MCRGTCQQTLSVKEQQFVSSIVVWCFMLHETKCPHFEIWWILLFLQQLKRHWDSAKTISCQYAPGAPRQNWVRKWCGVWMSCRNKHGEQCKKYDVNILLQSPAVNRQTILHTRIHTSNMNEYRNLKFQKESRGSARIGNEHGRIYRGWGRDCANCIRLLHEVSKAHWPKQLTVVNWRQ